MSDDGADGVVLEWRAGDAGKAQTVVDDGDWIPALLIPGDIVRDPRTLQPMEVDQVVWIRMLPPQLKSVDE